MQAKEKRGEVSMQENRNASNINSCEHRGTVCISTRKVLDSCRDRDCFEDVRVFLTAEGEDLLSSAQNIRVKNAKTVSAYVGVNEVPFNEGFYRITVRYYILLEFEGCVAIGRSQTFAGITAVEKDVILYGGNGSTNIYTSSINNNYCGGCEPTASSAEYPVAVVESVEPIVLNTRIKDCNCSCCDYPDIPETVFNCLEGTISNNPNAPKIYVSLGIFSVIRIERDVQLLVQATDYSVPDKECCSATSSDDPCDLFKNIAFPISRFNGTCNDHPVATNNKSGGCGCGRKD